ncbi:MAG: 2-C-methyl-D-erythritol 2,4-cyclodiphosphate synthase [Rickettsiaceae bacterium H1]|nr:2-C-methyl-D-erythritol 2,4-cyclodiphosphate synthase [Rickettsiaceae bacterium H1]
MKSVRIGHGYDVHKFVESSEKFIMLCGLKISHSHAVEAHSDGDVGIHALVDAMLGAVACGDIGKHFPPSDQKWKNVDSSLFLAKAKEIIVEQGYEISNLDITVICERPKIKEYKNDMRERIAEILQIDSGSVSIKATTTEKLGFLGRKEGIAAHAVVCLYKN